MKGIYIIIGIVVIGLVAFLLMGKKKEGDKEGTAENSGTEDTPLFGANFGKNFGVLRGNTETFDNWFARRQADGWSF